MKDSMRHCMQTDMINQKPMGLLYMGVLTVGVVTMYFEGDKGKRVRITFHEREKQPFHISQVKN